MKLLKNLFKITTLFFIIAILFYIMASPFICAMEGDNIHLYISIPLLILFLAAVNTYDFEKHLKL